MCFPVIRSQVRAACRKHCSRGAAFKCIQMSHFPRLRLTYGPFDYRNYEEMHILPGHFKHHKNPLKKKIKKKASLLCLQKPCDL